MKDCLSRVGRPLKSKTSSVNEKMKVRGFATRCCLMTVLLQMTASNNYYKLKADTDEANKFNAMFIQLLQASAR